MTRGVAYALGVAAAGALATAIAHGGHDGLVVAAILAPLGVITVLVAHRIARARGLRRQFAAMAAIVVAQLAALIALMAAAMFVEGSDAFFTVIEEHPNLYRLLAHGRPEKPVSSDVVAEDKELIATALTASRKRDATSDSRVLLP